MEEFECQVCLNRYQESGDLEPRLLPCGHTYCFLCLSHLPRLECPLDRIEFSSIPQLPKNRSLLNIQRMLEGRTDLLPTPQPGVSLQELTAMKQAIEEKIELEKERVRQEKLLAIERDMATHRRKLKVLEKEKAALTAKLKGIEKEERRQESALAELGRQRNLIDPRGNLLNEDEEDCW